MDSFVLTPEILAGIAGAIISLLFSYIPGLSTWFAALGEEVKRLVMAGIMLAAVIAIWLMSCGGLLSSGVVCDQVGLMQVAWIYILAVMANQGIYKITPRTSAVKAAKAQAK